MKVNTVPYCIVTELRANLQVLTQYKIWADQVFYRTLSELPAGELTKDRPMFCKSIVGVLHHVYSMDLVWKAHLEGQDHGQTTRIPIKNLSFSNLFDLQISIDGWFVEYTKTLSPNECEDKLWFEFIGGGDGVMSRAEIITHVVNHASYHRGHIEGSDYTLFSNSMSTDYSVFQQKNAKL